MTAEFGIFFLILALCTATLQSVFLLPVQRIRLLLAPCLAPAAWLQALLVSLALATLVILRLMNDFSVENVVSHSNRSLPLLYKISGAWGNHEGSMLLWVWVIAVFGAILAMGRKAHPLQFIHSGIATQSVICAGALAFIIFTSSPFERVFPPTADGQALNPLLQDMALAIHPPILYLGYVGFSIVFSLAVSGLIHGHTGREWAHLAHPWILVSWSALTVGIGLGSWWAYRVLGWGGFWFWDPVENASLLPWLTGTALLHANIVLKKRGSLSQWVILLSILTFGMSMLGTFLVRSGVLVSVHSFASDPQRGLFILLYLTAILGWALALFATKTHAPEGKQRVLPLSREGMIIINNIFLLTACATVLLGTLYPMLAEWISREKISVGPPYFNATALPLLAIPLIFAGLTPFMPWKKAALADALRQSLPALMAALVAGAIVLAVANRQVIFSALGMALCAWLLVASLSWLIKHRNTRGRFSVFLGHTGAALLVAGITGAGLWKSETERWMSEGDHFEIAGYHITLDALLAQETPNHSTLIAQFSVDGHKEALTPEYRTFAIRKTGTSIASIALTPWGDLYGVIGEPSAKTGKISARFYYNPLTYLIWAGFMLMALGGITATMQRHHHETC
jgi:cytochrome c-type biogenesis protein CcmF